MKKVALIIIYNHQYNKNIDILERIYKDKFSHIYHLVPFYNGEKENVIPVYESSYYFQGYIAQGVKGFFKEEYSHYFFVADDLILNPVINENNYAEHLNLNAGTSFIPGFIPLHDTDYFWVRACEGVFWSINFPGVEARNQLPGYDEALQKFQQCNLTVKPLRFEQIRETPTTFRNWIRPFVGRQFLDHARFSLHYIKSKLTKKTYSLSYPIVGSYSDICVVSSETIKQFCHYCGVFSATKLFVELALPTSLVLSANEIIEEKDLKLKGKALWAEDQTHVVEEFGGSLKKLLTEFPDNCLYIHPIKLSKWDTEL